MKLPKCITDALPGIRSKIASLKTTALYAKANHEDNFVLVIAPLAVHYLMLITISMDSRELSWNDWWKNGFKNTPCNSSKTPDHSEFVKIGQEMARSIYAELRNKPCK